MTFGSPFSVLQTFPPFRCHARTPVKKLKWLNHEDELLRAQILALGPGNWPLIAQAFPGRTGKQCRERWLNQLDPRLSQDEWTADEDAILVNQQQLNGNCWSTITQMLPGRSATSAKNRWRWLNRQKSKAYEENMARHRAAVQWLHDVDLSECAAAGKHEMESMTWENGGQID
jgi:hypothetical protein